MNGFCTDDDPNTLCINDYDFESSSIIKPPEKKKSKLAQKFIFIDTADLTSSDNITFTIDFEETIKDIVEIELMSCQMPAYGTTQTANIPQSFKYNANYILLDIENIDIKNYKIASNTNIQNCFARLPIPGTTTNVFFGRIKNFTNVYTFKPILQKLNKLVIRITDKDNVKLNDGSNDFFPNNNIQLTFGITYQTQPDLFD